MFFNTSRCRDTLEIAYAISYCLVHSVFTTYVLTYSNTHNNLCQVQFLVPSELNNVIEKLPNYRFVTLEDFEVLLSFID